MGKQRKLDPQLRNEIFRAWARGVTPAGLAEMYELQTEHVQEIVREEAEKHPLPGRRGPLEVIRDQRIRVEALLEELAMVASKSRDGARVRALEVRFKVLKHEFELDQALGVVPRELGELRVYIDGMQLGTRLLEALEKRGLADEELVEEIMGALRPDDPLPEEMVPPELLR